MTNQLPGNEYAKLADDQMNYIYESGQINESDHSGRVIFQALNAVVQSNLTIAYEQRTSNMIRFIEIIDDRTDLKHRIAVIEQRLGLDQ